MTKSFRSSPVIIDVVNRVFQGIGGNAALANHREAANEWNEAFDPHETALADLPGYCTLETTPAAGEGEKAEAVALRFAARRVAQIVERAKGRSIGILVRENKAVAILIHELRQCGVRASEEGGNPITDSVAVSLILSLLTLADHPGDTIARFHVATSPLGRIVGLAEDASEKEVAAFSRDLRHRLLNEGYGRTLLRWERQLSPLCSPRDRERLMALVDLGFHYDSEATLRPADFVAKARVQKVDDPTSADVRVMTIHQSKGLEFDIVVLPQLEKRLLGQSPPFVVRRPGTAEQITGVVRFANESIRELLPDDIQSMFADYRRRAVREALCLLYVAITRAVHALHMFVVPASPTEKTLPAKFSGVLRGALTDGKPPGPEQVLFESGNPRWQEQRAAEQPRKEPVEAAPSRPPTTPIERPVGPKSRILARHTPSSMEGGAFVHLRNKFRLETNPALERGSCLHSFFELVGWIEEGLPDASTFAAVAERLGIDKERGKEYQAEFARMVACPEFAVALSRTAFLSRHGDRLRGECTLELWRERPFAVRRGDELWTGTFDRVVLARRNGKLLYAEIQDFKTDVVAAGDLDALASRVEYYAPQMSAYRQALHAMTGMPLRAIRSELLFVAAEKMVGMDPDEPPAE